MKSNTAEARSVRHGTVRDVLHDYHRTTSVYQQSSRQKEIAVEQVRAFPIGKRIFDLVLGGFLMLGYLLLYPFFALAIKWSSPGPVIFKQKRTGYRGESFTCYKFRTMHTEDNIRRIDGKPVVTEIGDRRIFRFGHLMRKLNLDELPQIVNVLRGDLSIVGPRPYPVDECRYWNDVFDDHHVRYLVKPGLSGLAQIKGLRGGTHDKLHMRRRLNWDLHYVKNYSFRMDLYIVWHTILQMIKYETNAH